MGVFIPMGGQPEMWRGLKCRENPRRPLLRVPGATQLMTKETTKSLNHHGHQDAGGMADRPRPTPVVARGLEDMARGDGGMTMVPGVDGRTGETGLVVGGKMAKAILVSIPPTVSIHPLGIIQCKKAGNKFHMGKAEGKVLITKLGRGADRIFIAPPMALRTAMVGAAVGMLRSTVILAPVGLVKAKGVKATIFTRLANILC